MASRARGPNEEGGFVKWDWNKNKYIWVSKDDIKKSSKPGQSKYAWKDGNKVAARRPSYKVPVKKACRQPLQVANKHGKIKTPSPRKPSVRRVHHKADFILPGCDVGYDEVDDKENCSRNDKYNAREDRAPPPELHSGHTTILSIMSNRLIHLNAALTFWRQGPNDYISYVMRTEDDAATVDTLPVLIHCLKNKTPVSKQLSLGACFDLLPTLKKLLSSKYEDYVKTSLDTLRTMLRFWWTDLIAHRNQSFSGNLQESRSVAGIYMSAIAMTDIITKLCKRQDSIAKKAEVVGTLLAQL
ncbi:KATNB1-like protein 1 [Lytechinus variegatus]|uniref:KATNB1-like protein 1 n=1 Tax=Lytechinus variegatus TaxID=7654 RepID=UPI001BB181D8|nr:KATNB1-like protein 1 [Lytechinus variegatus]